MDETKHKMAQHRLYERIRLTFYQIFKSLQRIQQRLISHRNMARTLQIDRVTAKTNRSFM